MIKIYNFSGWRMEFMGKLHQLFGDMWCRDSKKGENLYWACATIRWYRLCRLVQWNTKLYWKWMSWYVSQVWAIYDLLISTSLWISNSNDLGFLGEWMIFRSKLYLSQTYRSNISLDNILNVKNNFYFCYKGECIINVIMQEWMFHDYFWWRSNHIYLS